jgi:hypothetical protein
MNHLEFEKKKQNIQIVSLIVSRGFTKVELHAKASIRREEKTKYFCCGIHMFMHVSMDGNC